MVRKGELGLQVGGGGMDRTAVFPGGGEAAMPLVLFLLRAGMSDGRPT